MIGIFSYTINTVRESWKISGSQVSYILGYADSVVAFQHYISIRCEQMLWHLFTLMVQWHLHHALTYADGAAELQHSKNRGNP